MPSKKANNGPRLCPARGQKPSLGTQTDTVTPWLHGQQGTYSEPPDYPRGAVEGVQFDTLPGIVGPTIAGTNSYKSGTEYTG
jgi:hypothetical protein